MDTMPLTDSFNKLPDNFVLKIKTGDAIAKEKARLQMVTPSNNGVLPLVPADAPVLSQPIPAYDFSAWNAGAEASKIENALLLAVSKYKGLGLAANQIGLPVRAFVVGSEDQYEVMFNPDIIEYSEDMTVQEEGCLTFPGLYLKVKRSSGIVAKWQNAKGQEYQHIFTGMTARIIQHELDHLNGIVFTSYATAFELRRAKEKAVKNNKKRKRNNAQTSA
jgi:peptide deformylase